MTFLQAIVIGIVQGVTELFPVSSLGHTVLVPALIGGSWAKLVAQEASPESPYLAFVVGLHVATSAALILFFWREWLRLLRGLCVSAIHRRIDTDDQRLAWLILIASVPVGLLGLVLEHPLRVLFAKPVAAAAFLTANGVLLGVGQAAARGRRRRRPTVDGAHAAPLVAVGAEPRSAGATGVGVVPDTDPCPGGVAESGEGDRRKPAGLSVADALGIGVAQTAALCAGISRDGICMVAGLWRGLSREDAAGFAFLLSAPPIFAAGLLKLPDLLGPLGTGIRPQILAGSGAAFVVAFVSVWFLTRYFRTRSLLPMAVYCLLFGVACLLRFGL